MTPIMWWIIAVGFVAPAVLILALVIANRLSKGNPGKAINGMWMVLLIMLLVFLGYGIFQGAQ